ncbi:acetophenone carboxylase gamma subunit [Variibacter gotjawalensis]|uniref:Acetophenone carboxylase gamma subunit n=1 Tax=Variibacter gotjawalensis TaxID=1333996 RepID=A0A0S3PU32_9BRAD|nr:hydantoinase/oxoprolinase family protein [Variibacter gotjawalensis]NIK49736.1 N-methylhydantoinase A [Variibacter gotjawalensis]RZS45746.1 N-methylhydantoinase A [Variibacter gotjawalensis]BAT59419.1 acetophenone carboxylase gamma subunit [Variibacter gotjawalensis]
MQVGVEIGGTFTDLVWVNNEGVVSVGKVPSTPSEVHRAVENAVDQSAVPLREVKRFTHGSTIATNALITRRGAKTGLLATKGFRDIIEIGLHDRVGNIYTAYYHKPRAPVERRFIREIPERIDGSGAVVTALDEDAARREIQYLLDNGVTSIAICLMHAYRNPVHEERLRDLILAMSPGTRVGCSSRVSPEFREYERTVTTVVNAFVSPVVVNYIDRLGDGLTTRGCESGLQIMQSNGGIMPADAAGDNSVRMLLSGPAAGVQAAAWFARRNNIADIITIDMGGTSTDVAVAPMLEPRIVQELTVDDLPIRTTALDMVTVGAGGGSIAALDAGGFLNVGPASAGAEPGPACYGRGGTLPTVTDAQLIAGLLRPSHFFAGKLNLDVEAAKAAFGTLAMPGDLGQKADAVLQMVNSNMAAAVRLVSTARGIDPRDFTLVAYGGGGPLHAATVADEVGMNKVLMPWSPGITSAFGLLIADLKVDFIKAKLQPLTDETLSEARASDLGETCDRYAANLGLAKRQYTVEMGLDLRYAGQGFELTIWRDIASTDAATLRRVFEDLHNERYGYQRPNLAVQIVNTRARLARKSDLNVVTPIGNAAGDKPEKHEIVLQGRRVSATFVSRASLRVGDAIEGPAILEEPTTTTLVPPGWVARCRETGDLVLEKIS